MAFPYDTKKKPLVTPVEEQSFFGAQTPFASGAHSQTTGAPEETDEDVVIAPHSPTMAAQYFTVPNQQHNQDIHGSVRTQNSGRIRGGGGGSAEDRLPSYEETRPSTSTSPSAPLLQSPLSPSTTHYSTIPIPPPEQTGILRQESRVKQCLKNKDPYILTLLAVAVGLLSWCWPVAGIVIGSLLAIALVNIVVGIVFGYISRRRRRIVLYLAFLVALAFILSWASSEHGHDHRTDDSSPDPEEPPVPPPSPPSKPTPGPGPSPGPSFERTLKEILLATKITDFTITLSDANSNIEVIQTEEPTTNSRAVFSLVVKADSEQDLPTAEVVTSQSGSEFEAVVYDSRARMTAAKSRSNDRSSIGRRSGVVVARLRVPPGYPRIRQMKLVAARGEVSLAMLGTGHQQEESAWLAVPPLQNLRGTDISELSVYHEAGSVKLDGVMATSVKVSGTNVEVTGNICVRKELTVSTTSGDVDLELLHESYKDRFEATVYSTSGSVRATLENSFHGYFNMIGREVFVEGNPADIHYSYVSTGMQTGWRTLGGRKPTYSSSVKLQSTQGNATLVFQ
ncbi:hypothetical protein DFQ27_003711 [Actinomortierella ambigua]|uniref:DUF4097 domain-containing protein n=1 Tax=Actinomortierella ambigua TaxID=1343610 RepID=A0A9P6QIC8_9FUNG|nr:hypothetical protein DFQ27_003711 [Actinomortierella ambigua]